MKLLFQILLLWILSFLCKATSLDFLVLNHAGQRSREIGVSQPWRGRAATNIDHQRGTSSSIIQDTLRIIQNVVKFIHGSLDMIQNALKEITCVASQSLTDPRFDRWPSLKTTAGTRCPSNKCLASTSTCGVY